MVSNTKLVKDVLGEPGIRIKNGRPQIRTLNKTWKSVNLNTPIYHRGKARWSVDRKRLRKRKSYKKRYIY